MRDDEIRVWTPNAVMNEARRLGLSASIKICGPNPPASAIYYFDDGQLAWSVSETVAAVQWLRGYAAARDHFVARIESLQEREMTRLAAQGRARLREGR